MDLIIGGDFPRKKNEFALIFVESAMAVLFHEYGIKESVAEGMNHIHQLSVLCEERAEFGDEMAPPVDPVEWGMEFSKKFRKLELLRPEDEGEPMFWRITMGCFEAYKMVLRSSHTTIGDLVTLCFDRAVMMKLAE